MKRTPLRRRAPLRARTRCAEDAAQADHSMAATDAQRAAVAGRPCIVCGAEHRVDAAHVVPRALGCGDALDVVPLCRAATAPTTPASSTCSRTWSRASGRRSRTPSGMWG